MVGRDRLGDVLHHDRLANPGWGDDQAALALAKGRDDVDDPAGPVLQGRILHLHPQPLLRVEGGQVVEQDLVTDVLRGLEIDLVHLDQGEIALAFPGGSHAPVDRVAGAKAELPDLGGTDIDVVGAGKIVGLRGPQEAEAIGQDLHGAGARDFHALLGQNLEDGEHHVLLAHGVRVLDLQGLGKGQQVGWGFILQLLKRHARQAHGGDGLCGLGGFIVLGRAGVRVKRGVLDGFNQVGGVGGKGVFRHDAQS